MVLKIRQKTEINAYVDASFGVHGDIELGTGTVIMIGNATVYVKTGKQKIVTRSSTEAELVGVSDALSQILWTREFLIHQGQSTRTTNRRHAWRKKAHRQLRECVMSRCQSSIFMHDLVA